MLLPPPWTHPVPWIFYGAIILLVGACGFLLPHACGGDRNRLGWTLRLSAGAGIITPAMVYFIFYYFVDPDYELWHPFFQRLDDAIFRPALPMAGGLLSMASVFLVGFIIGSFWKRDA